MKPTYIYALLEPSDEFIPRYIGKSVDPKNRFAAHCKDFKEGKTHKERWIRNLHNNGLKPKLKIIAQVESKDWQYWEIFYIDAFLKAGFNLTNETDGGDGNHNMSDIVKAKISKSVKGFRHSDETKEKISRIQKEKYASGERKPALLGTTASEETKKKMSESQKKINTEEHKKKLSIAQKNSMTEERKLRISKTRTGMRHSEEAKKKMSESAKNRKNKESK